MAQLFQKSKFNLQQLRGSARSKVSYKKKTCIGYIYIKTKKTHQKSENLPVETKCAPFGFVWTRDILTQAVLARIGSHIEEHPTFYQISTRKFSISCVSFDHGDRA